MAVERITRSGAGGKQIRQSFKCAYDVVICITGVNQTERVLTRLSK